MTLDKAIKHAEEVAEEQEEQAWEAQLQEEYGKVKPCKECAKEHRQFADWLKELKRLREQTKWIPVSERMPEVNERVLVTLEREYDEIVVDITTYGKHGFYISPVVAWMPLPEPYKAESEEV